MMNYFDYPWGAVPEKKPEPPLDVLVWKVDCSGKRYMTLVPAAEAKGLERVKL
jgi:hypothetical protein